MGKGLNILGQGKVGWGVVVVRQDGGREVQVVGNASGLSRRVVEGCVV